MSIHEPATSIQEVPSRGLVRRILHALRKLRPIHFVMLAVVALVITVALLPQDSHSRATVQAIRWSGIDWFSEWGETSSGLFGLSTSDLLHVWTWDGPTLKLDVSAQLPRGARLVPLPDRVYLTCLDPHVKALVAWPLVLASVDSQQVIRKWDADVGWGFPHTGASRNGRYAVAIMGETDARDDRRRRIGLLDVASRDLRWVAELNGWEYGEIRQVAASNDGRYIAIGGWDNGTVMVDTSLQKVLWSRRPPEAGGIRYLAFSPDGESVYEGDSSRGCVFTTETRTGEVLERRYATVTGEPIYGHRISCMTISSDGAWIAAGTGPEGQVYLFDLAAPQARPMVFSHGFGTILIVSFSPDSRHLASVAGGVIKIWPVPQRAPATSRPSATATRPGESLSQ